MHNLPYVLLMWANTVFTVIVFGSANTVTQRLHLNEKDPAGTNQWHCCTFKLYALCCGFYSRIGARTWESCDTSCFRGIKRSVLTHVRNVWLSTSQKGQS
ncbi:hypothetical protein EV702DRAFT_1126618 [Suillus placidus]|uniref:Uncharacterized protein n=1 Tax=Suillus placidus TaxID=48579 RepID=A0A9P6ZPZ5_9AGAM|nr:hypothetical protein EV702DRAFT_1126618 [Suillus placidus]